MKNPKKILNNFPKNEKKIDLSNGYSLPERMMTMILSKNSSEIIKRIQPLLDLISSADKDKNTGNNINKIFSRIKDYENNQFKNLLDRWNFLVINMNSKESPTRTHTKKILLLMCSTLKNFEKISNLNDKKHYCLTSDEIKTLNKCFIDVSKIKHKLEERLLVEEKATIKNGKDFKYDADESNLHLLYTSQFSDYNTALSSPISQIRIDICKLILKSIGKHTENKNIERIISKYNKKILNMKNMKSNITRGRPRNV